MAKRKLHGIQFDNPDEYEVFHAKESWIPVVLGAIPIVLIGVVLCVVVTLFLANPIVGLLLFCVCLAIALVTRIPRILANLDTDVIVTDRRLYARTGIVDIKDQVCDLSNVSDVTVDPTVFGRLFDYADVRIQTFAGDQDFDLRGIAHAYEMRQAISRGSDSVRSSGNSSQSPRQRRRM